MKLFLVLDLNRSSDGKILNKSGLYKNGFIAEYPNSRALW